MSKAIDLGPVTAYAIAVKNGFTGTEAEWLASLGARIGENGNWWVGDKDLSVLADPAQLQELTGQASDAATSAAGSAETAKAEADRAAAIDSYTKEEADAKFALLTSLGGFSFALGADGGLDLTIQEV